MQTNKAQLPYHVVTMLLEFADKWDKQKADDVRPVKVNTSSATGTKSGKGNHTMPPVELETEQQQ